jgi:hypothetical protein
MPLQLADHVEQTNRAYSERARRSRPGKPILPIPRDQQKNHDAIAAVLTALSHADDMTPWAAHSLSTNKYSLWRDYQIDPDPLLSFNSDEAAANLFHTVFKTDIEDAAAALPRLIDDLKMLEREQLLGKLTAQKMSYVRDIMGHPLRSLAPGHLQTDLASCVRLILHTIDLIGRSIARLPTNHPKIQLALRMIRAMEDCCALIKLYKLFADYSLFKATPTMFYKLFADQIVQTIATRHRPLEDDQILRSLHFVRGTGVEWTFAPRDQEFVFLGDAYGDCTAHRVRSQVDERIANIHWTVYSWLMDPYYRVLEVLLDGKRALKCHLLPLVIEGRPLLMMDAVEAVPQLRERKDGSANPNLDRDLDSNRLLILETLFEVCKDLAQKMGLKTVYVEKFSNAKWIRDEIENLPSDSYHVSEVEKPYWTDIVEANIQHVTDRASASDAVEEIQAINLRLMDRNMQRGYKDAAVLMGRRENWRLRISGP